MGLSSISTSSNTELYTGGKRTHLRVSAINQIAETFTIDNRYEMCNNTFQMAQGGSALLRQI